MPDGERRKPIDIEVCRSKALFTHMFATFGTLLIFFNYHANFISLMQLKNIVKD